jgi:chromosomal replication initiation ATPase DnaA
VDSAALGRSGAAESGTLVLCAPNRFILDLVRERFASRIGRLAAEANGRELEVKFVLAPAAAVSPRAAAVPARIATSSPRTSSVLA